MHIKIIDMDLLPEKSSLRIRVMLAKARIRACGVSRYLEKYKKLFNPSETEVKLVTNIVHNYNNMPPIDVVHNLEHLADYIENANGTPLTAEYRLDLLNAAEDELRKIRRG